MSTIHLVALPHTRVDPLFSTCAYTQKTLKFLRMMRGPDQARQVILYAPEGSGVGVTDNDNVVILSDMQRKAMFGPAVETAVPFWPEDRHWQPYNDFATAAIRDRCKPGDLLLLAGGWSQHSVAERLPELRTCEPFVGYEGIFSNFCAFESHAWRHHIYGIRAGQQDSKDGDLARKWRDGRAFDTVIPNYFDPAEFPHINDGCGDYLLFVGRVTRRKGPDIAAMIAKEAGMRLLVAGPGVIEASPGRLVGDGVVLEGDHVEYVGQVGVAERAKLMADAYALIAPTVYIEPFGGVAVEAMMCGTPVIASDWGAFTETVVEGLSGFRFSTLQEGVDAVSDCGGLSVSAIRDYAMGRYSLPQIRPLFNRWFDRLDTLDGKGWYHLADEGMIGKAYVRVRPNIEGFQAADETEPQQT